MSIDFEALGSLFEARSTWIGDGRTKTRIHSHVLEVVNPLEIPPINPPSGVTWPEQLFPAALAACYITTMTTINQKMKLHIGKLEVSVKPLLAVDDDGGYKFEEMRVHIDIEVGPGESKKARRLIELAQKYCLISKAIKGNVAEKVEARITESPSPPTSTIRAPGKETDPPGSRDC
jgi:organic hydroperoxide reductase OsmC/OhrA